MASGPFGHLRIILLRTPGIVLPPPDAIIAEVSHLGSHLYWTAVTDATGYTLEQNINSAGWTTVVADTGNVTEYTVTGLAAGVSVQFRITTTGGSASTLSNSVTPNRQNGSLLLESGIKLFLESGFPVKSEV